MKICQEYLLVFSHMNGRRNQMGFPRFRTVFFFLQLILLILYSSNCSEFILSDVAICINAKFILRVDDASKCAHESKNPAETCCGPSARAFLTELAPVRIVSAFSIVKFNS